MGQLILQLLHGASILVGNWWSFQELGPLAKKVNVLVCNIFKPVGAQLRTWAILVINCAL